MEFDINRVYTAIEAEQVKVGSVGYFADSLDDLKTCVLLGKDQPSKLIGVGPSGCTYRFNSEDGIAWNIFYLASDSEKELCTNRELSKWLASGNGECLHCYSGVVCTQFLYELDKENNPVELTVFRIRKWEEVEWQVPTRKYMGLE